MSGQRIEDDVERKTILIGLDGATFTILDPLMKQGVMPFLSQFVAEGAKAGLITIVPALTPPAWTSMVTGTPPGHHGILDFFLKEPNSPHIRFATFQDIKDETVWSIVSRHGRRVTSLNFPVMLPPPKVDGNVIGGWVPWRQLRLACHPKDLYDRVKAIPDVNVKEVAMDMATEEKAIEGCRPEESVDWVNLHTRREENWERILHYLMTEDPCDLTAVLFDGMDKIQHMCWRMLDPIVDPDSLSPLEKQIRENCLAYYARMDEIIRDIVEAAGPDANVFIASDHGFGAQRETFFANAWLEQQGYLAWADETPPSDDENAILGVGQLARHVYMMDWNKTKAYAATPSGNGIHIVRKDDKHPNGVTDEEYDSFRAELVKKLAAIPSSVNGDALIEKVWTREEAHEGPCMESAPDLTLVLRDGGLISILDTDHPVKPRAEPAGTHHPRGVFLARGPGIRSGIDLGDLSILDVAPTLLYSLDLPIPPQMQGKVEPTLFNEQEWQDHPVRREESQSPAPRIEADEAVLDADSEAEVTARLKALGYL